MTTFKIGDIVYVKKTEPNWVGPGVGPPINGDYTKCKIITSREIKTKDGPQTIHKIESLKESIIFETWETFLNLVTKTKSPSYRFIDE